MILTPSLDAAVAVVENPIFRDAKTWTPDGAWATEQRTYTGGELLKARYFAPERTTRRNEIDTELTELKLQREKHLRRRFLRGSGFFCKIRRLKFKRATVHSDKQPFRLRAV